ncbi:MAG: NAD(P)/FAD-dependent oxidoreductase [Betaproteobacteria bacterium]
MIAMAAEQRRLRIAIIGGGLTGLALAERLRESGHAITVLERDAQIGGLATWHDYGEFEWDRFYHVILPSDGHLIGFIHDIGLGKSLHWRRTLTGVYVDRLFHSMSSGLDFLRFRPISLWGKIRLAATILYCARITDWRRLEQIKVAEWLYRLCGRATYEKIWRPLLLAKLGDNYERVSAVFIWSYIKRMFSARDPSTQKEQLGYVSGGYKTVFKRIQARMAEAGGSIRTGVRVLRIEPLERGLVVYSDDGAHRFDKVIFTGPTSVLQAVASKQLYRVEQPSGGQIEYLGVVCMVLVTERPLVPYYVVNIADARVPFTGIIGMSNLVSTEETAGLHLTYLPKYVHSDDPLLRAADADLRELFEAGLRVMFPAYESIGVRAIHMNRAIKVQPLQTLNYSRSMPAVTTAHNDFFVLNTSQFAANTLNNNAVIGSVDRFIQQHGSAFGAASDNISSVLTATSISHTEKAAW